MTEKLSAESLVTWARSLGLDLPPTTVAGVEANFALLAQLARVLEDAPLSDTVDEPASTFVPR